MVGSCFLTILYLFFLLITAPAQKALYFSFLTLPIKSDPSETLNVSPTGKVQYWSGDARQRYAWYYICDRHWRVVQFQ